MDDIISKIQSINLTRKDAEIADYISEHLTTIGLQTSTELAHAIGVSDTSVIRFIRKLGFKSFAEFRSKMNARITEQYKQVQQDALMPGAKFSRSKEMLKHGNLISDVSNYTLSNLEKSFAKLDAETLEKAVEILLKCKRKYICGFRGSASCAYYMASRLVLLFPGITVMTHADSSVIEQIMDIEKDDCLLIYSFPRHSKIYNTMLEIAVQRGAKVILITDRYTSPLAAKADIVIVTHVDGPGFTNSYIAPMCITEVLILALSRQCRDSNTQRVQELDRLMEQEELY